jgi:hypothetical protein
MEIVNGRRAITFGAHRRRIKQSKGSSAWLMCRDLRVLDSTAIQAQEAALDLEHRMIMIRAALANQQPHQALPQAKPLDCIGVPDLGETAK